MKKIVKLNEDDLKRIVVRVMNEQAAPMDYSKLPICKPGESGKLVVSGSIYALSDGKPFCRIGTNAVQGGGSKPTPKPAQPNVTKPAQPSKTKMSPQNK